MSGEGVEGHRVGKGFFFMALSKNQQIGESGGKRGRE